MKTHFTLLAALLLAPMAILHAVELPAGKTYTYKYSSGQPREMEIYFPPHHDSSKARVPGLILFHGGGWIGGDLGQFHRACEYFASRGLVAATVNYQMLSKEGAAKLPAGGELIPAGAKTPLKNKP